MKAAVLYGKEDVRLEDLAERELRPGEVRIRIEAALTCGTDLKVFKRGYHAKMLVPPTPFGHELAGTIAEIEPSLHSRLPSAASNGDPADWRAGDRVVVANSAPCGDCFHCRHGQENLCDDLLFLNGAYASSIIVPERLVEKNLLRLAPETPFRDAALTEPLACVVLGLEELAPKPGQRLLVIGAGPIGLMCVRIAAHLGCEVYVAGRGENRLTRALQLGAARVIDVSQRELVTSVREAIQPEVDLVFEAVGKPETWEASTQLVRKGGRVNFFGGCPGGTTVSLDTARMHYSSISTVASFHHTPATIRRALSFIEQRVIRASDFVDGECSLADLPAVLKEMAGGNRAVKTFVNTRE